MAFNKNSVFVFETDFVEPATSVVDGKVTIPLAITKEDNLYHGFVPGVVMNDIICEDIKECELKVKDFIRQYVYRQKQQNLPYPFFPSNEEIKSDFKKVVLIKRLTIKLK